jgi:hypothetical protein
MHFVGPSLDQVVLVSEDGKRVYFTSPKRLVPGEGVRGAKNLYTANDEGGELAFIGTVKPNDSTYTQATSDGGDFTFDSKARLTAFDNAGHSEIYFYDAASGSLRCVSCRPDGQAADSDAALSSYYGSRARALTSDGGRVFFETADGLLPEDANGLRDVYQYHDGRVSLVSTGTSPFDSQIVDNSPDGKNVFFTTRDALVGQDIDGSRDIYDARIEGGFPAPPPRVSPCEGEGCQGQAHGAPAYSSPGTASLSGSGNPNERAKKITHTSCGRKAKKQHSKCGTKTKKHKSKKHQAKKTSKSGRGK